MNWCQPETLSSLVVNCCFFFPSSSLAQAFASPIFRRMGGPSGNPYANNRHADVLNEEPTDETAKLRLCEEVKNRAKGSGRVFFLGNKSSFQCGHFFNLQVLFTKVGQPDWIISGGNPSFHTEGSLTRRSDQMIRKKPKPWQLGASKLCMFWCLGFWHQEC